MNPDGPHPLARRQPLTLLLLLIAFPLLLAAQCEDGEARTRADSQDQIAELTQAFALTCDRMVQPGDEGFLERRDELEKLLRQAKGMRDLTSGQKNAVSLVTAGIQRELGLLDLAEAEVLEGQLHQTRRVLGSISSVSDRLSGLASGRQAVDLSQPQSTLQNASSAAQQARSQYQQQITELSHPINKLRSDNDRDREEIDRVASEANTLRREASALGAHQGFSKFEEALALERNIDHFENQIAHREINLGYELVPEHSLAQTRLDHSVALIEAAARSSQQLDVYLSQFDDDAAATMDKVRSWADDLKQRVRSLESVQIDTLNPLYVSAIERLDQAAQSAQGASRAKGDDGKSAKVTVARLRATKGRILQSQIRGLGDHLALLSDLQVLSELTGDPSAYDEQLETAEQRHEELVDQATEAYQAAQELLSQATARSVQKLIGPVSTEVASALASLSGEEIQLQLKLPEGGEAPAENPIATPGAPQRGKLGAATHAEVIPTVVELGSKLNTLKDVYRYYYSEESHARAALRQQANLGSLVGELYDVMEERFGEVGDLDIPANTLPISILSQATLDSETEDRATYVLNYQGTKDQFYMTRVDGRWLLDWDSLYNALPDQFLQYFELAPAISQGLNLLIDQVKSGELSSTQAVMEQLRLDQ